MANRKSSDEQVGRERRRFFRLNDRVGLQIRVLEEEERRVASDQAAGKQRRRAMLNNLMLDKPRKRPALHAIKLQHPNVAYYLEQLEAKIAILAELIAADDDLMPERPTHDVNISAIGVRFYHETYLAKGTHVELKMKLFPSGMCLVLFGQVVWCSKGKTARQNGGHAIAVDYSVIDEPSRELLIRHIHALQLEQVQRVDRREAG